MELDDITLMFQINFKIENKHFISDIKKDFMENSPIIPNPNFKLDLELFNEKDK